MSQRLNGRTALVTGSTSNIGRAIAEAFAAEGARVVVSGRNVERGREVIQRIRESGGWAEFARADLDGSPDSARELAAEAKRLLGSPIDVLVNNAGIFPTHDTAGVDEALFDQIVGVNVKSTFFLTQTVVSDMIAKESGVVVNLGSWVARLGIASSPLYSSSKAMVEALTRAWSAEFGPRGVRVNAISPGVVRPPEALGRAGGLMDGAPSGAAGGPGDIAAAAVFLASDEAAFIHGTVLDVDGGRANVLLAAH